jgi:hypothetical protein
MASFRKITFAALLALTALAGTTTVAVVTADPVHAGSRHG